MNDHFSRITSFSKPQAVLSGYEKEHARNDSNGWSSTLETLHHLVLNVDETGAICRYTQNIEEWQIEHLDTVIGTSWHKLFHPRCKDRDCYLLATWDEARAKIGRSQSHECIVRDELRGLDLHMEFLPVCGGTDFLGLSKDMFAVILIEDISRFREIEDQFRLASTELKILFDVIPHIFLRLNSKGMILDWSVKLLDEEILPLHLEKGHFIHYVFPVPVVKQFIKAMSQSTKDNAIVKMQYLLSTPQGSLLFEASFLPITNDEIIVLSRDITEKIRLENIAESVQMMNNIGYIFSGIRHEIGNPINSIKMTMSVLKNNIGNYSRDKIIEYANRVLNEIHRVEYLLTSLKNFNMHENLTPKTLSLLSFIDLLLPLIEEDFKRRGILIQTDIRTKKDTALADARALQQVMLNLLNNAADSFLDPDNNPTIVIGLAKRGKTMELSVKDNGVGMSQYQLDNLFKPFFTSKPQGTGLGLVIVKKLMVQMNGDIEIESKVDEGTLIRLILQTAENE
jgi:signal transduction histidine kinase